MAYLAVILLVALAAGALVLSNIGDTVSAYSVRAVCRVGGADCGPGRAPTRPAVTPSPTPSPTPAREQSAGLYLHPLTCRAEGDWFVHDSNRGWKTYRCQYENWHEAPRFHLILMR